MEQRTPSNRDTPTTPEATEPHFRRFIWALLGGAVGAALVLFLQTGEIRILPTSLRYEDLAAVLLSAVGVIVAVFGLGLAILAFWGFGQLKKEAIKAAVTMASGQVDELIRQEIASPEMEKRITNRVDEIVLGSSRDKELDDDLGDEGDGNA